MLWCFVLRRPLVHTQALSSILPDIITTTTIYGTCTDWDGRCTLDAKGEGRILSVSNLNAVPIFVRLINLRFNNGNSQALQGALMSFARM